MLKDIKNLIKAFRLLFKHLFEGLGNLLVKLVSFLGPVEKSARNYISPEEFYRVLMLAGSSSGGFYGCIQYMSTHANEYITDPNVLIGVQAFVKHLNDKNVALAICIVVFLADYLRRKYTHGKQEKTI